MSTAARAYRRGIVFILLGSVHVVERDRVTFLETSAAEVLNCISQWGVGAEKALGGARP